MKKYEQENLSVSNTFGIITPCSATYHLEVGVPISLKVGTKACYEDKTALII